VRCQARKAVALRQVAGVRWRSLGQRIVIVRKSGKKSRSSLVQCGRSPPPLSDGPGVKDGGLTAISLVVASSAWAYSILGWS